MRSQKFIRLSTTSFERVVSGCIVSLNVVNVVNEINEINVVNEKGLLIK